MYYNPPQKQQQRGKFKAFVLYFQSEYLHKNFQGL